MKEFFAFLFLVITGRFQKAFEQLKAMGLMSKFVFLALGGISYVVHQYPQALWTYAERGYFLTVLVRAPQAPGLPLSSAARSELNGLIATLEGDQAMELRRRNLGVNQGFNTWAVSQMTVALEEASPVQPAAVKAFFSQNMDKECGCWRETPQKQPHTGATGWTIFALSKLNEKAPAESINYVLSGQSPEGWWALHPATQEPRNASTYATAWATLALCSQLPLYEKEAGGLSEKIKASITSATDWMKRSAFAGEARWYDYPANDPHIKSISLSGLVLHTLHACGSPEMVREADPRWLDALPDGVTDASDTDVSNTYIELAGGELDFDRTRHYKLQWQLVATVDAYAAGNRMQKAAALQWIEAILKPGLASPDVRNKNWVSAELLYALKYLRKNESRDPAQTSVLPETKAAAQ